MRRLRGNTLPKFLFLSCTQRKCGKITSFTCAQSQIKGDLGHMESPEKDAAVTKEIGDMVDSLFARLPMPPDPLKAALQPTKEELANMARFESLKEAMREKYLARRKGAKLDDERIATSQASHGAAAKRHTDRAVDGTPKATGSTANEMRSRHLKLEMEEVRQKLARLKEKKTHQKPSCHVHRRT